MDISKKYIIELTKISNLLVDLENGRIYEITHTPGTPSYATLAQHLRESINELLHKIEANEPSIAEKVAALNHKL